MSFLGYTTSAEGIQPGDRNVIQILNMFPPFNVKEVEKFCGLVPSTGGSSETLQLNSARNLIFRETDTTFKWTTKRQMLPIYWTKYLQLRP